MTGEGRGWEGLLHMGTGLWMISFPYFSWQFYVREELGFAFMSVNCMLGFHYGTSIHVHNILWPPYAPPLLLFLIYSLHMEATLQKLSQQACFCGNSSGWKMPIAAWKTPQLDLSYVQHHTVLKLRMPLGTGFSFRFAFRSTNERRLPNVIYKHTICSADYSIYIATSIMEIGCKNERSGKFLL